MKAAEGTIRPLYLQDLHRNAGESFSLSSRCFRLQDSRHSSNLRSENRSEVLDDRKYQP